MATKESVLAQLAKEIQNMESGMATDADNRPHYFNHWQLLKAKYAELLEKNGFSMSDEKSAYEAIRSAKETDLRRSFVTDRNKFFIFLVIGTVLVIGGYKYLYKKHPRK